MTGPLPAFIRSRILRRLLLHWRPDAIAEEVHCHSVTVYRIRENLFIYNSPFRLQFRPKGAPRKITKEAEEGLKEYLKEQAYAIEAEMVGYLWEELNIVVHQSTVSRLLKRLRINQKRARRLGDRQNEELRLGWQADMLNLTAEQLVFIEESMFNNEATGWRHRAYAPVGMPARYHASRRRGHSWATLTAYTIGGYLPCTAVKEGWFNSEELYSWLCDELLPSCNPFPSHRSVIIIDNASFHCLPRIG